MANTIELEFVPRAQPLRVKLDVDRLSWGDYERLVALVGQENADQGAMITIIAKCVVGDVQALPATAVPVVIRAVLEAIQQQEDAQKN